MAQAMRGIFTIPSTPFDEQGQISEADLRRVVDFCIGCGAHGLVYPVNASEFTTLSDEERRWASQIVIEQAARRLPVVIGVAGLTADHAASFARHAAAIGADAVIAMCPYAKKLPNDDLIVAYYQTISNASYLPIFVQNHAVGTDLSVVTMVRLVNEVEHVAYIKEETMPATHKLTALLAQCNDKLQGVFGGSGGRYLLLEHPRGSAGQMPGCHITDVLVRLWNALEDGDQVEAKRIFGLMGPIWALELQCRGGIYKEVLRRRGIIRSAYSRNQDPRMLDAYDHRALDEILHDLEPLFTYTP